MRLPIFSELPASKEMNEEFGGYNHNLRIPNSDWYDQKNMTLDYYPAASTREYRGIDPLQYAPSDLAFMAGGVTYTLDYEPIGVTVTNTDFITLHRVKNGSNYVGAWFMCNGAILGKNYPEEIAAKMTFFRTYAGKRNIVEMASYVCVLPDGVIYETANTTDHVPVYAINDEEVITDPLTFCTLEAKADVEFGYKPLDFNIPPVQQEGAYWFRFNDAEKQIEKYLYDDSLWVKQPTYVVLYKKNATGTFGNLRENDVINLSYVQIYAHNETVTQAEYKAGIFDGQTAKIIKKGQFPAKVYNTYDITGATDYIIVEGFVYVHYEAQAATNVNFVDGTTVQTTLIRKMPVVSDIAFAAQNRLWCCDRVGHEYYASALGNPYNFYDFSHLSTDSFAQNVLTEGNWTGGVSYNDMPIFFKESAAHIVNGYYPINDGVQDGGSYADRAMTDFRGCEAGSSKSFSVIDGILYYKSKSGFVAFDGNTAMCISDALGHIHYKNAVAGSTYGLYYVSVEDEQHNSHVFVYDTKKGMWSKEDNVKADFAFKVDDNLAFIGKSIYDHPDLLNKELIYVMKVADPENITPNESQLGGIEWMCETGDYGYSYPNNKYISRLQVRLKVAEGARAAIYIQYDSDGVWHKKGEMSNKGTQSYLLPIVPVRCDHLRLKFEGKGDVKIISIAKILEQGGDV